MRPVRRSEPWLFEFDLKGVVVLRSALEPELVDALEQGVRRLETAAPHEIPSSCPATWTPVVNERRFLNVVECGEPFERLIDHPSFLPCVERIIPGPPRLTEAFSITRGSGAGCPLHSVGTALYRETADGPACDHVTAAVFLSDCGSDDGPLVVFEGTHKSCVDFPYARIHPRWTSAGEPEFDAAVAAEASAADEREGRVPAPWEEIPGYREIHAGRGDVVFFAQGLWHGARENRSGRIRRSLYYSYCPYHFGNWHGVTYSDALRERVTPRRRALLSGPFLGARYPGVPAPGVPDVDEFPLLPDSERPPHAFEPPDGGA